MKALTKAIPFLLLIGVLLGGTSAPLKSGIQPGSVSFTFISFGDAQEVASRLAGTSRLAKSLNPVFAIFNGDLQDTGTTLGGLEKMTNAMGPLLSKTFLVRGNHDNAALASSFLWEDYFSELRRPLPTGVSQYVSLSPDTTYLTYSFDYGNSRFIAVDDPGDASLLKDAQLTFIDQRLADAESNGLLHAFLFFHGPEYCVESIHCTCNKQADDSCSPVKLMKIINKHPIVAATFHGHEHILGWVHMDAARIPGLTHGYEEFLTSPAGGYTYNGYVIPDRIDYYYHGVADERGFAAVEVNDYSFTVNFYDVSSPVPVWSMTFPTRALLLHQPFFRLTPPIQRGE